MRKHGELSLLNLLTRAVRIQRTVFKSEREFKSPKSFKPHLSLYELGGKSGRETTLVGVKLN
jgi:hypothetical protein